MQRYPSLANSNTTTASNREKSPSRHADGKTSSRDEDAEKVQSEQKEVDTPPNGGYGWVVVACVLMINAHTWGLNAAYGVFLAHYLSQDGLFPGAGPLEYAFIGGLSISQALMISPLVGWTTKHLGTTTTLLIGAVLESMAFIGASFSTQIWHVFLSQGVCFGWGMGFLYVGSAGITAQWFTTRRSLANGIAASGAGLGGVVYSLAAQAIIRSINLAWSFRILAIAAFTANAVSAILIKDRNKHIGTQMSFDYRLLLRWEFIGFLLFGILSELAYVVLLFSLPNYSTTIGLTHQQGSIIGALFNLGLALGRPIIGYYSDSIGRINMASAMTCLSGVFCLLIWMFAQNFGVLALFSVLGGAVGGTFWAVAAPVTTEVVGLVDLSAALSCTWLVLVLPTTCE
ncbi:MFS general substrate transporter [Decorospora gaudefroyi]|uniref:MFS general substrate transporter n=1 Tax=Decorospora gaudefroyi TaxID=184978 RepID=A0A6A5KAB4_9PLEO|nr:MFS general substrate transporter [Decorospora gaudefroyi]